MKRVLVLHVVFFVPFLVASIVLSSDECQNLCCFNTTNGTVQSLHSKKENCTTKCLENENPDHSLKNLCQGVKNYTTPTKRPILVPSKKRLKGCPGLATNNFIGIVKGIKVNFYEVVTNATNYWYVNISWSPIKDLDESKKWSHYAIQWITADKFTENRCALVAKNQTFLLINASQDGWKYPLKLELNVSTYPLKKDAGYRYGVSGYPPIDTKFEKVKLPKETVSAATLAAILVGSSSGIVLVVLVMVAWKLNLRVQVAENVWYRYLKSLTTKQRDRMRSAVSELTIVEDDQYYVSYYHEDDNYMGIVRTMVSNLTKMGYKIKIDLSSLPGEIEEGGPNRWATTQIANAYKVIVFCSPSYIKICKEISTEMKTHPSPEESRVWYEIELIGSIYSKRKSASKIICLWMNETVPKGLPPWMNDRYTWPHDFNKIRKRLESNGSKKSTNECPKLLTLDEITIKRNTDNVDQNDDVFDLV